MERLLSLRTPPSAVFVHSDEMAFGALRTLRRAGLQAPRDISVVSIDDHPLAEQLDLTTVHQDPRAQGVLAARAVQQLLAGGEPERAQLLPTRLVPRQSTAPFTP